MIAILEPQFFLAQNFYLDVFIMLWVLCVTYNTTQIDEYTLAKGEIS